MTIEIEIQDKTVDPEWLALTLEDFWDLVKEVRQRRGPKRRVYILGFPSSVVTITIERSSP